MSSETVAKSVGKKLRYYFEVKRLEDGFDLSGTHSPQLFHPPLKSATIWDNVIRKSPYNVKILRDPDYKVNQEKRPTLQYDGLHDRALKHYFSQADVKTRITQMHPSDGNIREEDLKKLLKRYMYKNRFISSDDTDRVNLSSGINPPQKLVGYDQELKKSGNHGNGKQAWQSSQHKHPTMPGWMYRHHPREGKAIKEEYVGFGVGLKSQKKKQFKGGYPVLRSVPSRKCTRGEAHRLIDVATKILVATEHVNGMKSRPTSPQRQTAPKPFETNKPLPGCTDGKKKQRPSTAKYSWDIHGRRHVRVKVNEKDKESSKSETSRSYDDSFIPDWLLKQQQEREKPRPKSPEPKPSPRPPSAKYRHREPVPPPPKPTVINVPEPSEDREEVRVNEGTQTADTVGIQTEPRLLEEYDHTEDLVTDGPWTEYQLYVRTGDRVGAATKDEVRVTLYGEKGRTKEMLLGKSSRNKVKFQRGKEDVFLVPAHHVGKLRKIKIGHDRAELSYAWYLDGVSVYDMTDKRIYEFKCDAWLSGRDGDRQTYKDLLLDCERAFVEAYDDVRGQSYPKVGRDRRKEDNSTESKASKDDKRSLESIKGSKGDRRDSDSESHTSFSSSSSSSSSSGSRGRGRKSKSPPRAKTPVKQRELSPPKKHEKDDFFDSRSAGPTFTFRSYSEDGQTAQEEYLSGYKAGLEASSAEKKHQHEVEESERKKVLQGPTIHDAARSGNLERMQTLINYYPEMKQSKDESGLTPLHVATQQGRLEIVKWLTALGINLNTETQTGYTAIHLAAMNGHLNCMIVLAAMGATLTCRSVDKQTPLHVAAMNGKLECVKWLIANRASLSAKDQLGRTAVDLAEEYQHREVEDFIRKCIEESNDPNSSLHEMRSSRKGLHPIREDGGRERNLDNAWRDEPNTESAHANDGSADESRSRNNTQMKSDDENDDEREKRRLYEQQQKRMEQTHSSFLDSIRDEATH